MKKLLRKTIVLLWIGLAISFVSMMPWTTAFAQTDETKETITTENMTTAPVPATGNCIPMPDIISLKGSFHDLAGHWAEQSVYEMVAMGVVSGYQGNLFQPSEPVTRAEFTAIFMKALIRTGNACVDDTISFADTKTHWAKEYISTAVRRGVVTGYRDTLFCPDEEVTREQMAVMIENEMRFPANANEFTATDATLIAEWARQPVKAMCDNRIMSVGEDGMFHPEEAVTRAEAVEAVFRALLKKGYVTK